ncbi:MAG: tetratricopeptide repeat protein [Anaerolineae bacterium]
MTPEELNQAVQDGKLEQAAAQLEKDCADLAAKGDTHKAAETANDLGVVYYMLKQYDPARAALGRAREQFEGANDVVGKARTMGNLARVEEQAGDKDKAASLYWEAAELFHQANERDDEFATMRSLSQLYMKRGGWLQALATFDQALQIKPNPGLREAMLHRFYQIPLKMFGLGSGSK